MPDMPDAVQTVTGGKKVLILYFIPFLSYPFIY
jgi:hypothetical protein